MFLEDIAKYVPQKQKYGLFNCYGILEHIEKPKDFVLNIKKFLNNEGVIFIMLPINVPHQDHIILFEDLLSVQNFLKDCGLVMLEEEIIPTERVFSDDAKK